MNTQLAADIARLYLAYCGLHTGKYSHVELLVFEQAFIRRHGAEEFVRHCGDMYHLSQCGVQHA